ncbi:MAG: hypothetical protein AB7E55_01550 [Pigmentiphaga sp.]
MLGLAMTIVVGAAQAQAKEPVHVPEPALQREVALAWEGQRERVLELLLEDTRRALAFASGLESAGSGPGTGAAVASTATSRPPVPPAPRLLALYGVDPHYTVVLDVDGQVRTYRPGASLPLERPDPAREYRLLRVADRCAVLRRAGQGVRTVCHAPRLGAETSTPDATLAGPLPWPAR